MMQDYPKNLTEGTVGCVQFEVGCYTKACIRPSSFLKLIPYDAISLLLQRWNSFSAVKNNIEEASKKQAITGYAESAASGEAVSQLTHKHTSTHTKSHTLT
jgi:hypothetical protein